MCKLCNTNTEPAQVHVNNNENSIEFRNIVYEYTGEYPCRYCIRLYTHVLFNNKSVNIDKYITNRIKRELVHPTMSTKQKNKWAQFELKHENPAYKFVKTTEHSIVQRLNRFNVRISINGTRHTKTFDTLEEAVSCRDNLIRSRKTNKNKE
jgi:hypothetical protein